MNWLDRLFHRQPSSAQTAKDRLQLVLRYDRANINPELLERIKNDIVNAISQHIDIDKASIQIKTEHGERGEHLVADIPLRRGQPARVSEEPAPASAPQPSAYSSRRDYPAKRRKKR